MSKRQFLLVLLLNLLIASSFFIKNIGVGYSQLSSDMHNIVPICMKMDNPSLFPDDLYLTDTNNFKFYTPFFVQTLRLFAEFVNGDYVLATNILLFLANLSFGIGWFLLLYRIFDNKFFIALFISVLMRGTVWLPMWEFWGISDLWTMMPRTLYIALLPFPFLILFKKTPITFFISTFLIGLIFNFHPISGLSGILIFSTLVVCGLYFGYAKSNVRQMIVGTALIAIGMMPFVLNYFGKTATSIEYDLTAFEAAFNAKIPLRFQEVGLVFKSWLELKFLFFFVPLSIFVLYSLLKRHKYRKQAWILIVVTVLLFVIPALSIYLENLLNNLFGINLRMSFQIVRVQKFAILPGYISMGFLLLILFEKHVRLYSFFPFVFGVFIVLLVFSNPNSFKGIPFLGDDISTSVFPDFSEVIKPFSERKTDFDKMADYIEKNTPVSAVFYGNFRIRSAAKRSVKYDIKGANLLVEGNPQKLIEWHQGRVYLKKIDKEERVRFLRQSEIDYILSNGKDYPFPLEKKIGNQKLYRID